MEGLSSEQETGQSQTAGIQAGSGDGEPADGEAENAKSTVSGVKLYQYGDEVLTGNPAKSNWNIYSYCVRKTETFQTLQDAGIQIEDLYSTKAKINGKISETCSADGTFAEGFGVLLLDIQVKAVSVPLKEEPANVGSLILLKKSELKDQLNADFYPQIQYSSKAPKENRNKNYYYLPNLKQGETTECQIGWIIPQTLFTNDTLVLGVLGGASGGEFDRGIAVTFEEGNGSE